MEKIKRYNLVNDIGLVLSTVLICILIDNAADKSLLAKLDNEKLRSEALLAEKLLLEKALEKKDSDIATMAIIKNNTTELLAECERRLLLERNGAKKTIAKIDRKRPVNELAHMVNTEKAEQETGAVDSVESVLRYTKKLSDSISHPRHESGNYEAVSITITGNQVPGRAD
jgi:hypothetical protein